MFNLILSNPTGTLALLIMLSSMYLQVKYIKFKKRSMPATGLLKKLNHHKFFYTAEIQFNNEKVETHGQVFFWKNKKGDKQLQEGQSVEIIFNPHLQIKRDRSILFTPIFNRLGLVKHPTVFFTGQNPAALHIFLLVIGVIFLSI
jgi:hypothetical protein